MALKSKALQYPNRSRLDLSVMATGQAQRIGKKQQHQRSFVGDKAGSLPPVLVIRATSEYEAKEATQLSFQIGDFFHVMGVQTDENGCVWFQVENPTKSSGQGLVPATHFEKYGPTRPANLIPIQKHPNSSPIQPQSPKVSPETSASSLATPPNSDQTKNPVAPRSSQVLRPKPLDLGYRSLFGIVKYPFVAERPDEMTARCGEPVIVVAHGAQEWFVVKPICRLGAPGLIPASYVELQEIQTCRVLSPERVTHLLQSSAIPTVDEWKKIVADHKARCISLGVISDEEESINSPTPPAESTRAPIDVENEPSSPNEQNLNLADWRQRQATFIEAAQQDNGLSCVEEEDENDFEPSDQVRKKYGILKKAHVISFHYEQGQFWYQVQAHLRNNSNGIRGAQTLLLYRLDTHFRKLESDLQRELKYENCTLPKLPHSATPTDEIACACRMEQLKAYLEALCMLPESIRMSRAVCEFLSPRPGDMEPENVADEVEISLRNSHSKFNPPILQLPIEANEPYTLENSFEKSEQMGESLLSDHVRSWITSWQATTADECRSSNGAPSPSTRPSSINSRSPSPTVENGDQRGSSFKLSPRHSLWLPDFDKPFSERSILEAA